ncbi:MAG: DUF1738 domain-containing protein [Burkholderiales bacterium]|nr:DUF1738 domain-containing protein [Burkholderiales bacterium]
MEAQAKTKHTRDLYATVTTQIVSALEAGVRPWVRPWSKTGATTIAKPMRSTGEPYRGINVLLLWGEALTHGYSSNLWFTFNQAKAAGAHVRRGEQGCMVVYAGRMEPNGDSDSDDEAALAKKPGPVLLRAYTVFNADQLAGLEHPAHVEPAPGGAQDSRVDEFFGGIGAHVLHGGDRAFYMPGADVVQLPPPGAFTTAAAYCATKAHELVHWTGHPQRLAREFGARFGDAAYAFEELVAELGAAFVCADLGLAADTRDDHAAYLASWLSVLKSDRRAIFTAATHAQRAADFLHKRQATASP